MASAAKKIREHGLDFFQSISAEALLEQIEAAGEIEIVSIYALGGIHFAWIRRAPKPKKREK